LGFDNYGGGIPIRSSGSPLHGSGGPPGGGNKPLKGGCGPPSRGGPPSGGVPLGGGCEFLVGGINVAFGAPCLGSLWNPWYPMCITTKCGCNSLVPIQ